MKICIYGLLLSVIFLISCQVRYTNNEAILRAEAVMTASPDSAYNILHSIPYPENLPRADYAAWCLHYTHALYKLKREIPSDSLIRVAVNYYKDSKLKKQSATAYYLLGSIEKKNAKNKEALLSLKMAESILKGTNENSLKGLIALKIGSVCMQDERYTPSLAYSRQALHSFVACNDRKLQAYAYRDISNMLVQLDYPFDIIMYYSNLALKLSKESGDSVNYISILARQGELLYEKDPARSNEYVMQGYRFFPARQPYYASFLALNYAKLHQPDSARHYLQISFNDNDKTNSKTVKYLVGAYLAKDGHNYKAAFEYLEKAYNNRDSVFQARIQTNLHEIDKQYDLTKKEEENATLEIANRNKMIWIAGLVIVVLMILVIFLVVFNRFQKKQAKHIAEHKRKDYELELKKSENNQKKELLLLKLMNRIENTLRFNRLKGGVLNEQKKDAFMDEIKAQSILLENEWEHCIGEVNHIVDYGITRLSQEYSQLTPADKIVIALICLKLDIPNSCSLLNMSKNAMYHRRSLIKERIGLQKEDNLEFWLNENIRIQG